MPNFFSNIFNKSRTGSRSPSRDSRATPASRFLYDPSADDPSRYCKPKGDSHLIVQSPLHGYYKRTRSISSTSSRRSAIEWDPSPEVPNASIPPPPYHSSGDPLNINGVVTSSRWSSSPKKFNPDYYRTPLRKESMENAYEILRKFNTVILVDDSYSMHGDRWREAGDALCKIADIASKFDDDGIDIHFLNSLEYGCNLKSSEEVLSLFARVQPSGATWLGQKLDCLLREYLNELKEAKPLKKIKPINYMVITDGRPDDQLDLEKSIVDVARRLDQGNYPLTQVGIQLVQIGRSRKAAEFLHDLDNALENRYHIRDIVDTTPYFGSSLSSDALIKIMLGGISRKIDAMEVLSNTS
ncbi:hypothetical protein F5876DRAFT_73325 [Lentinula aff. lateritia]|uniref:Uncharacterized protein n=1 Tax=Lentinula aff. lateritia TaxID=2804960 RepID=A0ACC1UBA8_9AGAR|nr:hypothetical protein F5876DRAFT_73325 [Lentinula aff. lateritia]